MNNDSPLDADPCWFSGDVDVAGGSPTEVIGKNRTSSTKRAPAHRTLFSGCVGMTGYVFMVVIEVTKTTVLQSLS